MSQEGYNNIGDRSVINRKRFWLIMGCLVALLIIVSWIKVDWLRQPDVAKEISQNKLAIEKNSIELNQTKEAVVNVSHNVKVGIQNQKTLARGLSDIGSVIGEVANNTDLIPSIKVDTSRVLNTTAKLYNVTIANITIPFNNGDKVSPMD